jgi:catechol 2,3-dioxygenase-like lactoylglutathione lyase family enzyme
MPENDLVSVRYMVDDVEESIDFYTRHFGFTLRHRALPAFADVVRGRLRLLLAGPQSSAGRPMPDGRTPGPGGWNRIHLIVDDIAAEVDRLRAAGSRRQPTRRSYCCPRKGRVIGCLPPRARGSGGSPRCRTGASRKRRSFRLAAGTR